MAEAPRGLLILGCGGHARSMADVALKAGYVELLFIDEQARPRETLLGFPVHKGLPERLPTSWECFPGSGDGHRRATQIERLDTQDWPVATLISPLATLGAGSSVGRGSAVGHHAHVGPLACVGTGCIINTGAAVEHDCRVGDYTHVSVHATLAGTSRIGRFCMLGAGATVIDRVNIADNVCIGAGAVVVAPIERAGTYVGVPVRPVGPAAGRKISPPLS